VLDENDDTDGYACPWCIDGEEPNPCAVPSGRREELTGRLLALLTDTPSVSLAVIANVVGVLPEQVWSLMAPLLRSGRLSYVAGRGNKPHTYTVHAERQAAR